MKINFFKTVVLFFVGIVSTSCDPGHSIVITNNSENKVKVKIVVDKSKFGNTSKISSGLEEITKGDSIVIDLKPEESFDIYFGMGTWEENDIDSIVSYIKTFQVETIDKTIIYKSKKANKQLLQNREGFPLKTKIKVDIE